MLASGARADLRASASRWEWDGRWLLVVLRVPEQRRDVRHQARTQLAWAGFGSLGGGLWISRTPSARTSCAACRARARRRSCCRFRAELGALGDPQD